MSANVFVFEQAVDGVQKNTLITIQTFVTKTRNPNVTPARKSLRVGETNVPHLMRTVNRAVNMLTPNNVRVRC